MYRYYRRGEGLIDGIQELSTGNTFIEGKSDQWEKYQKWLAEGNTPESAETTEETKTREQLKKDETARGFLIDTDWKVMRHKDQTELGSDTSLTGEEYQLLLTERQEKRDSILE